MFVVVCCVYSYLCNVGVCVCCVCMGPVVPPSYLAGAKVMAREHRWYLSLTPRHAIPCLPLVQALPSHHTSRHPFQMPVRGFGALPDSLSGTARLVDASSRRFHYSPLHVRPATTF
ncbi:hypothetical protein LZ30DRAFT_733925 [Colletotrichum cereale]|nr:hypothetical protein LZ30DRAFT_733925 [Colletotrichum cereale]